MYIGAAIPIEVKLRYWRSPVRGENRLGSEREVFDSLKAGPTASVILGLDGKPLPRELKAGGPSDAELLDKARRIYARQNGTYYILYEQDNKRKLDGATPIYREQEPQMQAEIRRLTNIAKQPTTKRDPLGFGPMLNPAPPAHAPRGKFDPFGFLKGPKSSGGSGYRSSRPTRLDTGDAY